MTIRKRLKTEVIQLRVSPELKERLKSEANEKGTTVIGIIEEALDQYFEETSSVIETLKKLDERIKMLEKKQQTKKR